MRKSNKCVAQMTTKKGTEYLCSSLDDQVSSCKFAELKYKYGYEVCGARGVLLNNGNCKCRSVYAHQDLVNTCRRLDKAK